MQVKYKRILLKISGEALGKSTPNAPKDKQGLDFDILAQLSKSVKKCVDLGVQVGIVVGGGNFWRGRQGTSMDRTRADHMGMLATVINALALSDSLEAQGLEVRVQTAIDMHSIAEPYIRNKAIRHLEKGRVVIFACGTGSPFFTTDTAASLRAAEISADAVLKATLVDGVYDSDPNKNPDAQRYDELTFTEIFERNLGVMDMTAAAMCRDNHIPVLVFSLQDTDNIVKVVCGESIATIVRED